MLSGSPDCISFLFTICHFSLSLLPSTVTTSRLQSISIRYISLSQHHYSRLNYFIIHFMDNEFKKTN
jgi:hypothetical protein